MQIFLLTNIEAFKELEARKLEPRTFTEEFVEN